MGIELVLPWLGYLDPKSHRKKMAKIDLLAVMGVVALLAVMPLGVRSLEPRSAERNSPGRYRSSLEVSR